MNREFRSPLLSTAVSKHPDALIFVAYVDVAAAIDNNILGLQYQWPFRHPSEAPRWLRRKKITNLNGQAFIGDVVYA
ncbi:MAG: hypothetical protein JOZ66_07625 [Hyphomicrobiales bacterium]|nr:hypothetical protein [Hyphomicrobiales bacterium]